MYNQLLWGEFLHFKSDMTEDARGIILLHNEIFYDSAAFWCLFADADNLTCLSSQWQRSPSAGSQPSSHHTSKFRVNNSPSASPRSRDAVVTCVSRSRWFHREAQLAGRREPQRQEAVHQHIAQLADVYLPAPAREWRTGQPAESWFYLIGFDLFIFFMTASRQKNWEDY